LIQQGISQERGFKRIAPELLEGVRGVNGSELSSSGLDRLTIKIKAARRKLTISIGA